VIVGGLKRADGIGCREELAGLGAASGVRKPVAAPAFDKTSEAGAVPSNAAAVVVAASAPGRLRTWFAAAT